MRNTAALLAKGFWGRTMAHIQRQVQIVTKMENIRGPSGPYELQKFEGPDDVEDIKLMSDQEFGGFSTSNSEYISTREDSNGRSDRGYMRWYGTISNQLPKDRFKVKRSGFAAFRTCDQKLTAFGYGKWDVDPWNYLALRIKSDGRSYFINIMTESIVPQDVFQHRLFAKRPGEWETVLIDWRDFMRTNHGMVIEPQIQLIKQRVLTVGISLIDRKPGPFELCVERIWATNSLRDHTTDERRALSSNGLKNKQGEDVTWKMD
ncbi:hypothetical protein Cpir12675_000573 [Ceratocystis pirilliformis]|uniref:NADH:ubiquinone oxidoreductase intermediate-associated protein 30 domain-containing protein n=1 Tax=Ceratocystis pirilliformis TaxID=259994 RepID=A0ABR3ZLU0_9PEZI